MFPENGISMVDILVGHSLSVVQDVLGPFKTISAHGANMYPTYQVVDDNGEAIGEPKSRKMVYMITLHFLVVLKAVYLPLLLGRLDINQPREESSFLGLLTVMQAALNWSLIISLEVFSIFLTQIST
ncbi:hypothetical protein DL96DRAFT_1122597 [Flagelloscypha sp. PMI_526]|nr:hypothetical protein DL96DRAFT_1122597 [Flagelloscypha sp. PMI_526]